MPKFKPDLSKPADIKLTRRQQQVLKYVRENPDCVAINVCSGVGMRMIYALNALQCLERLRWIRNTENNTKGSRWEAIDYGNP